MTGSIAIVATETQPSKNRNRSVMALARRFIQKYLTAWNINLRGVFAHPPGHFYSPLLDLSVLGEDSTGFEFDGPEYWECVDLQKVQQEQYYSQLAALGNQLLFPALPGASRRYHSSNSMFTVADAETLSRIIRVEKPRKIIEIGSGFSTAVMLDTLNEFQIESELTCVEPLPDRLHSLLRQEDFHRINILTQRVQSLELTNFSELAYGDILFVDSSHVAKIGSDVSHILLRILPVLKPGVIVHFHDIFYPSSYPKGWLTQGRAWNETLFLRAFLTDNHRYRVMAFNSFAGVCFPEVYADVIPKDNQDWGGSFWLRKHS